MEYVFINVILFQVNNNEAMLWFWATWETAQYCVLNRLRTPLGKAQDTFTSIESVLKSLAIESQHYDEEDTPADQNKGQFVNRYCND